MDATQYNEQLDASLAEHSVLDQELFLKLAEACSYDAASSVGWAEAKLNVLRNRLADGKPISLFSPATQSQVSVGSAYEFSPWVGKYFPSIGR